MKELSLAEYQKLFPLFGPDVFEISLESSLAARDVTGGTAPEQVGPPAWAGAWGARAIVETLKAGWEALWKVRCAAGAELEALSLAADRHLRRMNIG